MSGSSSPIKNMTGTSGQKAAKLDEGKYGELLAEVRPRAPRTVRENERLLKIARQLIDKGESRTSEESALAEVLTTLIERFEQEYYRPAKTKPHELLEFLMEEHGLRQRDLLDVFPTRSRVSEVLAGKRAITKDQAVLLGRRFRLNPTAFMDMP
jgi:HTH-type transcriptional regulator/antitoxin HigA